MDSKVSAQELRIGNWVNEEVLGDVKVSSIDSVSCWLTAINMKTDRSLESRDYHIQINHIRPIPLTPEILEKAGFKLPFSDADYYSNIHEYFEIAKSGDRYRSSINCHEYEQGPEIKYLHQLQNLFYSLTGQELTINL